MKCRLCNNKLKYEFLDLGVSAPSNSFIKKENLNLPEKSFPLRVMVCDTCWLVQTEDFVNASEMFTNEYAYFSSFSSSFLNHTKEYVDKMPNKAESLVVGISGGIDSSVSSTLSAMTGLKTIVLSMPIKQKEHLALHLLVKK